MRRDLLFQILNFFVPKKSCPPPSLKSCIRPWISSSKDEEINRWIDESMIKWRERYIFIRHVFLCSINLLPVSLLFLIKVIFSVIEVKKSKFWDYTRQWLDYRTLGYRASYITKRIIFNLIPKMRTGCLCFIILTCT